jgi:hypothetical protein
MIEQLREKIRLTGSLASDFTYHSPVHNIITPLFPVCMMIDRYRSSRKCRYIHNIIFYDVKFFRCK